MNTCSSRKRWKADGSARCAEDIFTAAVRKTTRKNPSFEDWIITREKGGGLFDQYIHDIDMINWGFGTPEAVTAAGMTVHLKAHTTLLLQLSV